jgi:hypothetical protein
MTKQNPRVDGPKNAPARKLKVFEASMGFYDTVVAAPSQAAALRAWGTHQNLFADGVARITNDRQAAEAALASPNVVLRRAVGTTDPFSLKPGVPKLPDLPRRPRKTVKVASTEPPEPPKEADRSGLNAAETALANLEMANSKARDELALRRRELEVEELSLEERYEEARARARKRVDEERAAYAEAGGT